MPDTSAIHDLLDRLTDAWNAGDAEAYARLFTEDADYVTFFGQNLPGRTAIEEAHRALFEGPLQGSRLTGLGRNDHPKVRFLSPDVALVVAGGGSSVSGGHPEAGRESTVTLVAVCDAGAWRFTAFQNTRRTPMPGRTT